MTSVIGDFVERVDFNSYEDFYENFKLKYEDDFNFGFDVVDKYAEIDPDKIALIWTNDDEEKHIFTFKDMKEYSNRTANLFKSLGIKKGDCVMLTLKNRYEWWFCMVALHKIGAIAIPATHMLKLHDIDFRLREANVKLAVSVSRSRKTSSARQKFLRSSIELLQQCRCAESRNSLQRFLYIWGS